MKLSAPLILLLLPTLAVAIDYRVEPLDESAPDEVSSAIAKSLSSTGIRVIRGTKTSYCDIWLCKELVAKTDFKPSTTVLYPFEPGQLIGVARFNRKGGDFRDQDVSKGVYTLRYAQQPVDGAHVGTSLTRDFLLLLQADVDKSTKTLKYEDLTLQSAEAAGSSHPALLSMQRVVKADKYPSMRHNDEHDWWIVGVQGQVKGGKALPIELVVRGYAEE